MNNRIALVTGASRGIGRACALALSQAGARVVLAARDNEKLEQAAAEIREAGREAYVVELDLASEDSIRDAFARTSKEFGPVEILVNNAGITRDGLAVRMKRGDWNAVLDTNLTGAFLCIQQALQPMMKARWGRIVNIASIVGETGNAGQANYSASKAGLIGLTKSLAQEMGTRGITVNAVAPGFVETAMTEGMDEAERERVAKRSALRRLVEPEDVANAVAYLVSDKARNITGTVMTIDAGSTA